jgi:hypothetical protein
MYIMTSYNPNNITNFIKVTNPNSFVRNKKYLIRFSYGKRIRCQVLEK